MGVSAVVQDGQIVTSTSATSLANSSSGNSSVNKDDFLQLLVAQMKYQDPLEPTSNTEWVSQYATFSELEEMQNMAGSLELTRASALVGQTVQIQTTDADGSSTVVQGNVDYVTYEAGKAYLSINGGLYSLDDLLNVVDPAYLTAAQKSSDFYSEFSKLAAYDQLSIQDKDVWAKVQEMYNSMSSYEKSFLPGDTEETMKKYAEKMANVLALAEEQEE